MDRDPDADSAITPVNRAWMRRLKARLFTRARPAIRRSAATCTLTGLDGELTYQLRRSNARRTLAMQVGEAGEVVVQAPYHTALSEVEGFILKHLHWLRARLEAFARRGVVWSNGMSLPFQGDYLSLNWREDAPFAPHLEAKGLHLGGAWSEVPTRVRDWYQAQAAEILPARLAMQAARLKMAAPALWLSTARTRWGSLSAQGRMGLNWRLVLLSADLIDYVICHELAHLRQPNHSPAFWREVEALYPDYRAARLRLRREGAAAMALGFDSEAAGRAVPKP